MRSRFALVAGLTVAACGGPTLDGSSEESLEQSAEAIREWLPEERRAQFDTALTVISLDGVDFGAVFATGNVDGLVQEARARLNGLGADDVFHLSDSIQAARLAEQLRQARQEIEELEARRDSARMAENYLSGFTVDRARAYAEESMFMSNIIVEMSVTNGLDQPVSRAYFRGRLQSPGRSVPWMQETFNYSIPGGLEPGESGQWRLSPNAFSGWRQVEQAPADAVFTAEVYRLDGADGEPLMGGVTWDEADEERLAALRTSVATAGGS
jgi:hypothetical protein